MKKKEQPNTGIKVVPASRVITLENEGRKIVLTHEQARALINDLRRELGEDVKPLGPRLHELINKPLPITTPPLPKTNPYPGPPSPKWRYSPDTGTRTS